jgi:hypothetical protein
MVRAEQQECAALFRGVGNQATIDAWRDRPADSLIGRIERASTPSVGLRIIGVGSSLRGLIIHQQDVRRPLGRAFRLDPDRLRSVLDAVLADAGGNIGSVERGDGLRLVADDMGGHTAAARRCAGRATPS